MTAVTGRFGLMAATPLALLMGTTPVGAQDTTGAELTLDEVVVTAQKREESLQDVPLSVEAVSGEKLAAAGIVRLDDLKSYVPNLQITETGIANNIYIRGIGSGLNQGFEQSVSTYADGIYRGRGHQSRMPFLDLQRVEVLRGPQPILFGKNAVAGAVNLVSARPTQEFTGEVRASWDVLNDERIGNLMLSGPWSDTFGARLAAYTRQSDGYVENLKSGEDEPQRDEVAGRLTLAWTPSGTFNGTFKVEGGKYRTTGRQIEVFGETPTTNPVFGGQTYSQIVGGGALPLIGRPNGLPQGTDASARNNVLDFRRSSSGDSSKLSTVESALTLEWALPGGNTLTSVSGYSSYDLDELCDCDFVGATVFNAGVDENYDQYSQELRITSPADQKVSWIAGAFYQKYNLDETDYLYVPTNSLAVTVLGLNPAIGANAAVFSNATNPRVFAQDSRLWSLFAQATIRLTGALSLTGGGRYSDEDKSGSRVTSLTNGLGGPAINPAFYPLFGAALGIVPHSVSGSRSEQNFSPLVNLQYRFAEDSMVYASWARGYKSGGFDARSNKPVIAGGSFEFEDEQATTYELGVKSRIGSALELNTDVFYTDYQDLQTSAFDGAIGFNVGNGSAKVRGVELEGRWQATEHFRLSGSLAYLDFEWTRYTGQCYFGAPLSIRVGGVANSPNCNYDGQTNQLAPEWSGVVSGEYVWPIGSMQLQGAVDVVYSGEYLASLTLDPATTQEAYAKLNARLALNGADNRWQVALIGRNLTDQTVVSYAGDTPLANNLFGARSYYAFVDPPRSLAIELAYRF